MLAAAGIFSVMSLMVGQRTREIGIRMAIGARQAEISRLVLGRALVPVGAGVAAGLLATWLLTGLVRSLLYGVEPTDRVALLIGTALLVAAALVAAWIPARRAARVDPVRVLRQE